MTTTSPHAQTGTAAQSLHVRTALSLVVQTVLWLLLVAYAFGLSWLCVRRYMGYNVGMLDIGNMAQAIGSVQRGEPLVSTYQMGRMSRLALHVELIYLLLAPFYALWSDPRLLLVIQAVLFTLGALPVYWIARRHGLQALGGFFLVVAYLFYPVAITSVLFDLHGDTLAIPFLLYTIDALDRRAWRRYAVFVALALSCKVYVALPIAMIGVLAWWYWGERRVALWTTVVAVVYGFVAFFIIRPLFVTADTPASQSGLNYVQFYFGGMDVVRETWRDRWFHVRIVLGPAILLAVIGLSWFAASLPLVLGTAISTGPGPAYAYWFHHYALAIPFIIMAVLSGAERIRGKGVMEPLPWRAYLSTALLFVVAANVVVTNRKHVDTPFQQRFWRPSEIVLGDVSYGRTERDAIKDRIIATDIPPLAPVAASPYFAPHLTNRSTLYLTTKLGASYPYTFTDILPRVDYVFADALFDQRLSARAYIEDQAIQSLLRDPSFGLALAEDGLLLFVRDLPADQRLNHSLALSRMTEPYDVPAEHRFGHTLNLIDVAITHTADDRLRATFAWTLRGSVPPTERYMAVSTIEGVDNYRIVHLPVFIEHPLGQWQADEFVRETFDVALPPGLAPGTYRWNIGWYNLDNFDGAFTDARSELPDAPPRTVATFTVEAKAP